MSTTIPEFTIDPVLYGQWNPLYDIPTIIVLSLAILLGWGNLLTVAAFVYEKKIRKVEFNYLLLAMAGTDLLACEVAAVMDLVQVAYSFTAFGDVWCSIRIGLKSFCIFFSLSIVACVAILRLYVVLRRRQTGSLISKQHVIAAIGVSALVGAARVVTSIGLPEKPSVYKRCLGDFEPTLDKQDRADIAFLGLIGLSLLSYMIQYIVLRGQSKIQPSTTNQVQTSAQKGVMTTGRIGIMLTMVMGISFLSSAIFAIFGLLPDEENQTNFQALLRALPYLQAWANPIIYLTSQTLFKEAVIKLARRTGRPSGVGPSIETNT